MHHTKNSPHLVKPATHNRAVTPESSPFPKREPSAQSLHRDDTSAAEPERPVPQARYALPSGHPRQALPTLATGLREGAGSSPSAARTVLRFGWRRGWLLPARFPHAAGCWQLSGFVWCVRWLRRGVVEVACLGLLAVWGF